MCPACTTGIQRQSTGSLITSNIPETFPVLQAPGFGGQHKPTLGLLIYIQIKKSDFFYIPKESQKNQSEARLNDILKKKKKRPLKIGFFFFIFAHEESKRNDKVDLNSLKN